MLPSPSLSSRSRRPVSAAPCSTLRHATCSGAARRQTATCDMQTGRRATDDTARRSQPAHRAAGRHANDPRAGCGAHPARRSTQRRTDSVQHATYNVQHATYNAARNVQRAARKTYDVQHAQHTTRSTQHTTRNAERTAGGTIEPTDAQTHTCSSEASRFCAWSWRVESSACASSLAFDARSTARLSALMRRSASSAATATREHCATAR